MRAQRRTNLLWGVVLTAAAVAVLLHTLDTIPDGLYDIIQRAWPALLILFGLSTLLRSRLPLSGLIALVISGALVVGVTFAAYSSQSKKQREDNQQVIAQPIGEGISLLEITVEALDTDITIQSATDPDAGITGTFVGSTESEITVTYTEGTDGRASFSLREEQPNQFPMLEAMGRGTLELNVPTGIAIALAIEGQDGQAILNMSDLSLERLSLELIHGDVVVTLPEYAPQSPNAADQPGTLVARDGNVSIFVPQTVAARFELNRQGSGIDPQFPDATYLYLVGDVLEARNYEDADIRLRYLVTAPHGLIRIENVSGDN